MKLLIKLTSKPKTFQRIFGLKFDQFQLLVKRLSPLWEQTEFSRRTYDSRVRKVGGGRPYLLETLDAMVVTLLLYYKTYLTQEFIGCIVGLDQANVSRLLKKLLPLIEQSADPELATYLAKVKEEFDKIPPANRINNWNAFVRRYPDLKDVSTDATEQQCYRSTDYETQKKYYSGKKKKHVLKTQISVSESCRILDVSATVPGSVHDKKLIDNERTVEKFPEKTCQRFDSGYQGIAEEYPNHYVVLPNKKPRNKELSPLAKELNHANSKRRVIAEHALSRIKKFRICSGLYRGKLSDYNTVFRNVVALINFKLTTASMAV